MYLKVFSKIGIQNLHFVAMPRNMGAYNNNTGKDS